MAIVLHFFFSDELFSTIKAQLNAQSTVYNQVLSQLFPAFKKLRIFTTSQTVKNWTLAHLDVIESISVLKSSSAAAFLAFKTQLFKQLPQVPVQLFVAF